MSSDLPAGWRGTTWGELATLEYGKALKHPKVDDGPVEVFGTNGPTGRTTVALSNNPTVIVGRKGAYRGIHWAGGPFWVIDTAFYLRPDTSLVEPRWAYYELLNHDINSMDSGSAIPSTSREDFYALRVKLPPLEEQREIAAVLGVLDQKIEAVRRVEEAATSLLTLAFTEFCIRRADPDWETKSLAEIADFINGRNFTRGASGSGRPVLRIKDLNSGLGGSTVWNDVAAPPEHVAAHFDLLFAWSGTLGVYRWDGPEALVNQHIFKVLPHTHPAWWVECWLERHLARFRGIAEDKAVTMGHIRRSDLDEAKVIVPPDDVIARLDNALGPLDNLRATASREARTLSSVREALRPRLMSGRLRVGARRREALPSATGSVA